MEENQLKRTVYFEYSEYLRTVYFVVNIHANSCAEVVFCFSTGDIIDVYYSDFLGKELDKHILKNLILECAESFLNKKRESVYLRYFDFYQNDKIYDRKQVPDLAFQGMVDDPTILFWERLLSTKGLIQSCHFKKYKGEVYE